MPAARMRDGHVRAPAVLPSASLRMVDRWADLFTSVHRHVRPGTLAPLPASVPRWPSIAQGMVHDESCDLAAHRGAVLVGRPVVNAGIDAGFDHFLHTVTQP